MPKTSARRWLSSAAVAIVVATGLTVAAGSDQADPRTVTVAPIADTYVQADQPDTNFGSSVRWSVEGRPNVWRNALLRFDVAIPAGEEVASGRIRAYSKSLHPQLVVTTQSATAKGTTAAATHNWGPVVAGDEFNYAGPANPAKWSVYDSPGHLGKGLRRPSQVTVDGSKLIINGTANGTTGGMSAKFAHRKYGRWETRMALPSGDNEYHGVALLWPDSRDWPCDGEIDYAENTGDRSVMRFFLHYSCKNQQTRASKAVDATAFHNYAVDWSPAGITGYIDGVQWFHDDDPAHQPPGGMHQTLQLDWFPDSTANGTGRMLVDWVRVYAAD
jgi:beta-glucanase (GH16 family)